MLCASASAQHGEQLQEWSLQKKLGASLPTGTPLNYRRFTFSSACVCVCERATLVNRPGLVIQRSGENSLWSCQLKACSVGSVFFEKNIETRRKSVKMDEGQSLQLSAV